MNIDLKKLITILENKSNRAINMLDEIKCTTPEFKTILDSVLNNLNAIKQVKQFDIDCPDCKSKEETLLNNEVIPVRDNHQHKEKEEQQPPKHISAIGKKWISFKGAK
jgi:hypothetical protein